MALTQFQAQRVAAVVMRELSAAGAPCAALKSELVTAIQTIDGWLDNNAPALGLLLPAGVRASSPAVKAALLAATVLRRTGLRFREDVT